MPSALIHRVRVWFWCFNVNIHVWKNDSALKMTFVIVCIKLYVYWLIVSLHMYFPLSLKICTSQIPHIILPLLLFDCWISMVIQPRCFGWSSLFNWKLNRWKLLCLLCFWNPHKSFQFYKTAMKRFFGACQRTYVCKRSKHL